MNRSQFDEYIRRFNEEDPTAFDDYIATDMKMLNGALEFSGVAGMRDHYENKIWPYFVEKLYISAFIGNDENVCVKMWTNFTAKMDADSLFGAVKKGEQFDFRGLILYDLNAAGKFSTITVAYNSFKNTKISGEEIEMGIPH
ncbi:nuclear transport factor 2 family protein [Haliea sp. AH-315-K21]|uniref:Nuclear transport factor 2 family protein n=1 Tax=SAR86 cluster bacterium TaxID=2030880 RepID=A0A2A5C9C7_9GAMM|nr:nuclear transport factor 2 family protein [Haliea sp. AH-315-K21]PCJ40185.1 MAG: hypothetical protein COA71_11795 [SAR86 cluster bacterium]